MRTSNLVHFYKNNSKQPILVIASLFLFFSSIQLLSAQDATLFLNLEEILKIKTKGIIFINTENDHLNSCVKLALEEVWEISEYKIIEEEKRSSIKDDDFILAPLSLTLNDRFGTRTDKRLVILSKESLENNLQTATMLIWSTIPFAEVQYPGVEIESNLDYVISYSLRSINDCLKMIINNPTIRSFKEIRELMNKKIVFERKIKLSYL